MNKSSASSAGLSHQQRSPIRHKSPRTGTLIESAYDYDDECLDSPLDREAYRKLCSQINSLPDLCDPLLTRVVIALARKKINYYMPSYASDCHKDKSTEQCELLILDKDLLFKESEEITLPRSSDEFCECLFVWTNNFLNQTFSLHEKILKSVDAIPIKNEYQDFKEFSDSSSMELLGSFYKAFIRKYERNCNPKHSLISNGTVLVSKSKNHWYFVEIQLDKSDNVLNTPQYGECVCVISSPSHKFANRRYFGTVEGSWEVDEDGKKNSVITLKLLETEFVIGEFVEVVKMFSVFQTLLNAQGLFGLAKSSLGTHLVKPTSRSAPSGIAMSSNPGRFAPQELDCIQKALDTVAIVSSQVSPFCCLNLENVAVNKSNVLRIAVEIIKQLRKNKRLILEMNSFSNKRRNKFPVLIVGTDKRSLRAIDRKLRHLKFPTYAISRKALKPEKRFMEIAKKLVLAVIQLEEAEDKVVAEEILQHWDEMVKGRFNSFEAESKFSEFLNYARVCTLLNSKVIIGQIPDLCIDKILLTALPKLYSCIVLDAASIKEQDLWSLRKFDCQKFILMEGKKVEEWPNNTSLFAKMLKIHQIKGGLNQGAKCCIVVPQPRPQLAALSPPPQPPQPISLRRPPRGPQRGFPTRFSRGFPHVPTRGLPGDSVRGFQRLPHRFREPYHSRPLFPNPRQGRHSSYRPRYFLDPPINPSGQRPFYPRTFRRPFP